ncbi:MAG: peptidylprolyl isomerase [Candidatus Eiseniibacteriota bacterium]|nr:MAG: peptidylprolyl isomerase [Candidatus Eisenbacteria bacterium]
MSSVRIRAQNEIQGGTMKVKKSAMVLLATFVFAGLVTCSTCAAEEIEGIAAIVGEEIILKSEVDEQILFYCMQTGVEPTDTVRIAEIGDEILNRMIDAKVVVHEAKERKIAVSPQELDRAVDNAVAEVKMRMGSEEKFNEEMQKEGLTEEKLRERYRKELEAQLLAMKLVDSEIRAKINVTDEEVRNFYKERKSELPKKPPEVTLAQIVIVPETDSTVDREARNRAQEVLTAVRSGQSFERMAAQYSDDPSAENGGDVGFFAKGDFEEDFEAAAFALEPNGVSDLVKSRFGYHIIKLVEKREDAAHVKHILIRVRPTDQAEQEARAFATELRKRIEAGESFEELALRFSQDPETADRGGVVGSYAVEGLAPAVRAAIKGVAVGSITEVVPMEVAYHIFKIVGKSTEREYTFEEIRGDLRELVGQEKAQNRYEQWLGELKKKTYIEIKSR